MTHIAMNNVEPTGEKREDMRHAHLVSCVLNSLNLSGQAFKSEDVMASFLDFVKNGKTAERIIGPGESARMMSRAMGRR